MSIDKPNILQTFTSWPPLKDIILPSVRTFLVALSPLLHPLSFFFEILFFYVIFSFTSLFFMHVNDICKFSAGKTDITSCLNLLVTVLPGLQWQYYQDYSQIGVTGVRILVGETNFYLFQNVQTGSRAHPVYCLMVTGVLYRGQNGQSVNSTTHLHLKPSPCRQRNFCVISVFRHEVAENCALLCYYAVSGGNSLPTFRDNLSVPSSGFKNPKAWIHKPWGWDQ